MNVNKLRKLAARLSTLQEFSGDEHPEQASPVPAAVLDLIIFLTLHPALDFPSIVLTPSGNVRIQWRRVRGEHFAIEFLGDNVVQYVIFAPDRETTSGVATVDSIMQIAEPYGVLRWASAPENQTTTGD
jgi:hypothetical protein